ncbi:MAG: tRNA lysidine(34) synthetase TilS [Rhodanobacteraceae bacterium]
MCATAANLRDADGRSLVGSLRAALREADPPALCVAFSGGPDSTALLHALARLPEASKRGLRALHVDHGLHADSAMWAHRCAEFCASLDLSLATLAVHADDSRGEGIEAAARRARYAAFAEHLREGEWLVLGHHHNDQVETVLLKLLRGAGPEGLGGMRVVRPFARGFLWRPLLETPRETLRNYLIEQHLDATEDPANENPRFARNVVRKELVPMLVTHWPQAEAAILHSARLCREAADHLVHEAEANLTVLRRDDGSLDADGWVRLPDAVRAPVLDAWLHAAGLPTPPDASRDELLRQARTAAEDRVPCVGWSGAEVRVWDGALHAMHPLAPTPRDWRADWDGAPLALPADCGMLRAVTADGSDAQACFDPPLTARFRHGGERLRPAGDPHTRELRDLFQQAHIPPWLRARCPLIFADSELIAVADLWSSERGQHLFAWRGAKPRWSRPART